MKHIFISCLLILVALCSCSATNEAYELQLLCTEYIDDENVAIRDFSVVDGEITIEDILYAQNLTQTETSKIFPVQMKDTILYMANAVSDLNSAYKQVVFDGSLYNKQYKLAKSGQPGIYILQNDSDVWEIDLTEYENAMPVSIYVEESSNMLYVVFNEFPNICIGSASLATSLTTVDIKQMNTVFEKNEIPIPYYPMYDMSYINIFPCEDGFIYSDGAVIYHIEPATGEMEKLFCEDDILEEMPSLDSHRDFYGFFSGFGCQNGYYLLKFNAFNETWGEYVAIFDLEKNYQGFIKITENKLIITDSENNIIDEYEGKFYPSMFVSYIH